MSASKIDIRTVLEEEEVLLRQRRRVHFGRDFEEQIEENRFGIALSGGGIRSAVINLGFLKSLQRFNLLRQADYLSSVSGGGYTNSYIQAILQGEGRYDDLFQEEHIDYLRKRGRYLFPGEGWYKIWNIFVLVVAFFVSLLMSLVSPAVVILMGYVLYRIVRELLVFNPEQISIFINDLVMYGGMVFAVVIGLHYLFNTLFIYRLHISSWYNRLEAGLLLLFVVGSSGALFTAFQGMRGVESGNVMVLITLGFFIGLLGLITNPNATSFHRFYRKQLADAFLYFAGERMNSRLHQLEHTNEDQDMAPYPLINTTLNLLSSKDPNFQGSKASDYFLLSPKFCGSKLVGYVPTAQTKGYRELTLPSAITISAAAVNPGMGAYSNRLLSFVTTLLNLRLGFWIWNPLKLASKYPVPWWPAYFFYELFGNIGTDKLMVNISDGGHIENLGVMELLRRRCRLILAVDAEADPNYTFGALENLTVRARNELGIDIRFRPGQIPEETIRPKPSHGYSDRRFAVADMYQLWDKVEGPDGEEEIVHYENNRIGTFVYVKSSVTAPVGRPEIAREDWLKYGTYKYKIYNPAFPHESTADQFFDPIQWESYYQLGQWLAADILGCQDLEHFEEEAKFMISLEELNYHFRTDQPIAFPKTNITEQPTAASTIESLDENAPDTTYKI